MTKTYVMNGYIDKMSESDQDFRYMALNDIMNDVKQDSSNFTGDELTENKVLTSILKLLEDKISEVKNQAVKCLGVLSKVVRENQMELIMDKLIELFGSSDEETRDIAGLALKTITAELPQDSKLAQKTCVTLTPKLLGQLLVPATPAPSMIDILSILSTLVTRFPPYMSNPSFNPQPLSVLTPLLAHPRPAVRKRSIITLAQFLPPAPPEAFTDLLNTILIPNLNASSIEVQKTNVSLIAAVARCTPQKIAPALGNLLPRILESVNSSDPELSDAALQTLETFVYRCPAEISPYLGSVIAVGIQAIKYDPNYAGDDGDEDEDMEDAEDDDDDDGGLGEWSDDEDTSYKVRRSATKLLSAVIGTRPDMLQALYKDVSPILISRFGDRETLVKTEIWATYVLLLNQTALSGHSNRTVEGDSPSAGLKRKRDSAQEMTLDGTPYALLSSQVPQLAKQLLGQLKGNRVPPNVLQEGFRLLTALLNVIPGALSSQNGAIINLSGSVLSQPVSTGTASLHLGVLSFLKLFFSTHSPSIFGPSLPKITPVLLNILSQRHPRVVSETFRVFSALLKSLRPVKQAEWTEKIYSDALQRLMTNDTDAQVRQCAENCIGELCVCAPDVVQNKGNKEWEAILRSTDRTENPIKVVNYVAKEGTISDEWVNGCIAWLMNVLKKGGRQGKVEAFSCLETLIRSYRSAVPDQLPEALVNILSPYMSTGDIALLSHSFIVLSTLLEVHPAATYPLVENKLLKNIFVLSLTPLLSGASLDSLLTFYSNLVTADQEIGNKIVPKLLLEVQQGAKNTTSPGNVAKCIAKVVHANTTIAAGVITQFARLMQTGKANDLSLVLSLMTLGELGRFISMANQTQVFDVTISFFGSDLEEVKSAAAFAVGSMAIGDMNTFLPPILRMMEANDKQKLLALHALKEVVSNSSASQLEGVADGLWNPLFENSASSEEASRNVAASCLGKLTTLKPAVYLPRLQARLRDPAPSVRATVISALRYTFIDSARSYDELLGPVIIDFLSLIQDQDLTVQQLALSALNSAARNKPHLIIDHLSVLVPALYSETMVKPDLVEIVEMGPWKHKVDKGVDARKAAFETMYTLLDNCVSKIELQAFLERVLKGLSDESDEIKVICHMMLFRIAQIAPTAVSQRLDEAAEPLGKTMADVAVEKNTVKQDLERASELQRSALRAIAALSKIQQPGVAPRFEHVVDRVKVGQYASEFRELVQ